MNLRNRSRVLCRLSGDLHFVVLLDLPHCCATGCLPLYRFSQLGAFYFVQIGSASFFKPLSFGH